LNRVIVDYKKLTPEILNLLVDRYPDGYGIRDIVKFTNHKGQYIEAVEVQTEETIYLVRISDELVTTMESFDDETPNIDEVIDMDEAELNGLD
jgi:hypothetical protein